MRWKICVRTFLSEPIKRGLFPFHAVRIHIEPLQRILNITWSTYDFCSHNFHIIYPTWTRSRNIKKKFFNIFSHIWVQILKRARNKSTTHTKFKWKNLRHNKIKCTFVSSLWHFNIPWGKFWTKFYYLIFFVSDPGRRQLAVRS